MKHILVFAFLVLATTAAVAQGASCVCTAGCKIAANSYPPGPDQPTACEVFKAGTQIASGPVVASSTIPVSNAGVCQPASAPYVPGVAGSVSCEVTIPPQAAGPVTITMRASNAAGESADSTAYTFQSVSALPIIPQVPVNLRPN
jgi:hypothetical protein